MHTHIRSLNLMCTAEVKCIPKMKLVPALVTCFLFHLALHPNMENYNWSCCTCSSFDDSSETKSRVGIIT